MPMLDNVMGPKSSGVQVTAPGDGGIPGWALWFA